jgi:hypothetical protein
MRAHHKPFFIGQLAALFDNFSRDGKLAEIVQIGGNFNQLAFYFRKTDLCGNRDGRSGNPARMGCGKFVFESNQEVINLYH